MKNWIIFIFVFVASAWANIWLTGLEPYTPDHYCGDVIKCKKWPD